MSTSRLQRYVSDQLSIHFGGLTIRENLRPDWMIKEDGARLELDFFIEELNIAIEVQGAQHYIYSEFFHGNHEGFKKRLEYDRFKREQCFRYCIELFEVASEYDACEVIEKIITKKQKLEGKEYKEEAPVEIQYKERIRELYPESQRLYYEIQDRKKIISTRKRLLRQKKYRDLTLFDVKTFGKLLDTKRYIKVTRILEKRLSDLGWH